MPVLFGFTLALVWVGELVCRPDFVAFRVFLRCVCVSALVLLVNV